MLGRHAQPADGPLGPALTAAGVDLTVLPGSGRRAYVSGLLGVVRAQGPDLVHACSLEADLAGRIAAWRDAVTHGMLAFAAHALG